MKMACAFLGLAAWALTLRSDGQDLPASQSFYRNQSMSGFHGTWQWVQGSDTVKIFLDTKGVFFDSNGGYHSDMLIGWHIYKRGNSIVESSFSSINIVNGSTIMGSNENNTSNVVTGYFEDLSKRRAGEIKLTLDATATQITWELKTAPGLNVRGPNDPPHQLGFTVPTNMILIKQ